MLQGLEDATPSDLRAMDDITPDVQILVLSQLRFEGLPANLPSGLRVVIMRAAAEGDEGAAAEEVAIAALTPLEDGTADLETLNVALGIGDDAALQAACEPLTLEVLPESPAPPEGAAPSKGGAP